MEMPLRRGWTGCVGAWLALAPALALAVGDGNDLLPDIPAGGGGVRLELLVDVGNSNVTDIAHAGDGSGRLFLVSPEGVIRIASGGSLLSTPFLDAPAEPSWTAMTSLAFHPDFANNRKLYVMTGEAVPNGSTPHFLPPQDDSAEAFDNVLVEYQADAGDPNLVDTGTRRELLRIRQPHWYHNANDIVFGQDGYLYIVVSDGGDTRTGTPTHYNTNAQDTTNPYGSVLRIDVDSTGTNGRYAIPADNPFFGGGGSDVEEIYAWGLRAPWRITRDRLTGALYTGVNGDFTIESILRLEKGKNYGWDVKEGSFLWDPVSGNASVDPSPDPAYTAPLAEYDHNGSSQALGSVIGGYVYRGRRMPAFFGSYLFVDYVAGQLIRMNTISGALELVGIDPGGQGLGGDDAVTFGEDEQGELYIGTADGRVLRFAAQPAPVPALGRAALALVGALLLAAGWVETARIRLPE